MIELLADVRSRGGTLLLAIGGPDADGRLPRDRDDLVRELGLWLLVNREAVRATRPGPVASEGNVYFTQSRDGTALYAIDCTGPRARGEWRTLCLASVRPSADTTVDVLGQSGNLIEYDLETVPKAEFRQTEAGMEIRYCRAQRLYNDCRWPNPVALKITHPEWAL